MKQNTILRLLITLFLGFMVGVPFTQADTNATPPHQPQTFEQQQEMFTLSGKVLLQGRSDHNGINIYLTETACATLPEGSPQTQTDVMGAFETGIEAGKNYQCLYAQKTGFLMGRLNAPTGDIGTLTLLGGDVNGDNVINIFDLALIAGNYDGNDSAFDLNGDALVDIFDLTITAVNYNKRGPIQQNDEIQA